MEPRYAAFSGLSLGTSREEMLGAVMRALRTQSVESLEIMQSITKISGRVFSTGGNSLFCAMAPSEPGKQETKENWKFRYSERAPAGIKRTR